jgi:hypothetical protein
MTEPAQKANTTMILGQLKKPLWLAKEAKPELVDKDVRALLKDICTAYCNKADSAKTTLELRNLVDCAKAVVDNLYHMTGGIGKPTRPPNKVDVDFVRTTLTAAGLVAIPRPSRSKSATKENTE